MQKIYSTKILMYLKGEALNFKKVVHNKIRKKKTYNINSIIIVLYYQIKYSCFLFIVRMIQI